MDAKSGCENLCMMCVLDWPPGEHPHSILAVVPGE